MPGSLQFDHIIAPNGFGRYVTETETWSRPGSDGVNWRRRGQKAEAVEVTGRSFFDTEADANLFIDEVDDTAGTEVVLEDTINAIEVDCLIKKPILSHGRPQRVLVAGVVSGNWMVEFRLQIVRTS